MSRPDHLPARFARNDGLPFADVLTESPIHEALDDHGVKYRDRVFNPVATIWGFLSQVLSEDHSCRDAVARIIAHRAANGSGDRNMVAAILPWGKMGLLPGRSFPKNRPFGVLLQGFHL